MHVLLASNLIIAITVKLGKRMGFIECFFCSFIIFRIIYFMYIFFYWSYTQHAKLSRLCFQPDCSYMTLWSIWYKVMVIVRFVAFNLHFPPILLFINMCIVAFISFMQLVSIFNISINSLFLFLSSFVRCLINCITHLITTNM